MLCSFMPDEKTEAESVRARQLSSNEGFHSAVDPDSSLDQHVTLTAQHVWFSQCVRRP